MKKIILHIGAHKTGSTYLQKQLSDNFELLKKNKILYPQKWRNFLWGHHELVTEIMGNYNSEEYKRKFFNVIKDMFKENEVVLLSSENFEYFDDKHVEFLEVLSDIAEIEVIFYIRKISTLSFSVWQENIKHGSAEVFTKFLYKNFSKPFSSKIFNYKLVVDKFLRLKNSNIKVIAYDNLIEDNIDIAEHFFSEILRINLQNKKQYKINSSFDPNDIEVIRALNMLARLNNYPKNDRIRNIYMKNKKIYENELNIINKESQNFIEEIEVSDRSFIPISIYRNFYNKHTDLFLNANKENGVIFDNLEEKKHKIINSDIWLKEENHKLLKDIFSYVIDQYQKEYK